MDALKTLCSAYLHQDWDAEHDSPDGAVEEFATDADLHYVHQLIGEVHTLLLRDGGDDAKLRDTMLELGSYYDPTFDGGSAGDFLTMVRDRCAVIAGHRATE